MDAIIDSPVGKLHLSLDGGALTALRFTPTATRLVQPPNPLCTAAIDQLKAYFGNPKSTFDLPLNAEGTPFQKAVWQALQTIPVGETRTYGELARQLSTNPRAAGNACRANPIPIVIPCHRIVGVQGRLYGYMGHTKGTPIAIKRWLLDHEKKRP